MNEMPISSGQSNKSVKLRPAVVLSYLQHDADYMFVALQIIAKQENVCVRLLNLYQLLVQQTHIETPPQDPDTVMIESVKHDYTVFDELEIKK